MRIAGPALAAAFLAAMPAHAVPFSFLIGKWVLAEGACAVTAIDFRPDAMLATRAAGIVRTDVSYKNSDDRREVFVIASGGTTAYRILDDNRVAVEDETRCIYRRAP